MGEVCSLGFVFEEWSEKFVEGFLYNVWRDDDGHRNSFSKGKTVTADS